MHLFCFGFSYSAARLAERLAAGGWRISATSRREDKQQALAAKGIDAHMVGDDSRLQDVSNSLADVTHILHSVPPGADGDPVLQAHGADIAKLPDLKWFGYLSTTGVYGNRDGDWVDEESASAPTTERGRRRADAEAGWCNLHQAEGLPVHLFRLAGIYGPGRNLIDNLRRGSARVIDKPGQVFSRIHVDDIAAVLLASIAKPSPGRAYNLCDDLPAPSAEVMAYGADLCGLPMPPVIPFDQAEMSEMARSFYADNKRVSNRRIKEELGVRLAYPTYREGLDAIYKASAFT